MLNSRRTARLIRETIEQLELDLSGLSVLTEAATGHYAVTAAIAAGASESAKAIDSPSRANFAAQARLS